MDSFHFNRKDRLTINESMVLTAILQSFSTLSETILGKIEQEEPMSGEELESILTSAERKKVISEDNKLAAFFERKSRGQKQEAAAKRKKTSIAQQGEPKTFSYRMAILGGAVLAVLIMAVYFQF